MEFDRLQSEGAPETSRDVVHNFSRITHNGEYTLIQVAQTAARLPLSLIKVIEELTNGEHPQLILSSSGLDGRGSTNVEEVTEKLD